LVSPPLTRQEADLELAMAKDLFPADEPHFRRLEVYPVGAEEPAERLLRAAHARQLLSGVCPGDHHRPRFAHRSQPSDVVPVGVGQDHVADRSLGDAAERGHRGARRFLRGAGIDRDHALFVDQERDVTEVETLAT